MSLNGVGKYYPVQGSNKFQTVSFPITKAVAIDFGAQSTSSTYGAFTIPKGSLILGFTARVQEAYDSGAKAGTFQLGITGTGMLTSALSSGTATAVGAIVGPSSTMVLNPIWLKTDDTFDVIIGTSGGATAGKVDVYITYVPIPQAALSTSEFLSVVCPSTGN